MANSDCTTPLDHNSTGSATERPVTPCVGICSTGIGDSVCRGCKRFCHEVINWNRYTPKEQRLILQRLDGQLEIITHEKLELTDRQSLRQHLIERGIKPTPGRSLLFALLERLRQKAAEPGTVPGITIRPGYRQLSLNELGELIEMEFHSLACAVYETSFVRAWQTQSSSQKRRN